MPSGLGCAILGFRGVLLVGLVVIRVGLIWYTFVGFVVLWLSEGLVFQVVFPGLVLVVWFGFGF